MALINRVWPTQFIISRATARKRGGLKTLSHAPSLFLYVFYFSILTEEIRRLESLEDYTVLNLHFHFPE